MITEDSPVPSRAFREAASWCLAANLVQRHPEDLVCIETHPGGGQYDCLSLFPRDKESSILHTYLNREGSLTIFSRDGASFAFRNESLWADLAAGVDPRSVVNEIEQNASLEGPRRTPDATKYSVALRAIAAFLSHETIGEFRWEARSGFLDTSGGYGSHVSNEYFERFPAAAERLRTEEADDFSSVPAYRFWFLIERTSASRQPRLAIEATHGIAWDETGVRYDLMEIYRRDRRIWPVVFEVAGHLLP